VATETKNAAALIEQYIEANPDRPGVEEARLREYGVPVWALIGYRKATQRDAAAIARAYRVPIEAIEAALAYHARQRAAIDTRIAANLA
jgi:uncharacterized protein (DUF433 family)